MTRTEAALFCLILSLLWLLALTRLAATQAAAETAMQRSSAAPTVLAQHRATGIGAVSEFRDCAIASPVMVVIPAGKFTMGSSENEMGRTASEGPQHEVTVTKPLAVSK
jgi:formylglycine-generating enzyme required for sulfatase activity